MTMPIVTELYAGLLGLLYFYLYSRVVRGRFAHAVSLLDGGKPDLMVAIRTHANFTENVPLALVLLGLIEMGGAPRPLLHGLGSLLLVSRLAHAVGMRIGPPSLGRKFGAFFTIVIVAAEAVIALKQTLPGLTFG